MEGDWPMTVLESAAAGLPILSLKLNYGNLFSRYDGGYFCENSFEKLSASLVEILGDPLVYSVKSDGALSYILENHEIKANVRKLLTFLED
jgi:glycosyltransferase involved in cell wall biosynthesis